MLLSDDPRFDFLKTDHEYFPYYRCKMRLYNEVYGDIFKENIEVSLWKTILKCLKDGITLLTVCRFCDFRDLSIYLGRFPSWGAADNTKETTKTMTKIINVIFYYGVLKNFILLI